MKKYLSTAVILFSASVLFGQLRNSLDDGRTIRIPVVFHIIYANDHENIHDSLVFNEFQDLNMDFLQKNDLSLLDIEFRELLGNPNIEFFLLDSLLQEKGIVGVRRISKDDLADRDDLLISAVDCLNVFIADQGNASDILSDRVELDFRDVGKRSHVLTHETGHWMGLYHIFGQIGNSSWWNRNFGNRDDLIDDTPEQKGATAFCYRITPKCPCPPIKRHYKGHKRLYNNFMDYNPCRCMFTIKQAIKMRNNIIEKKRGLFDRSR